MRRLIMGVAAAVLAAGPGRADPIDNLVTEQMAASHLPGVAVAIVDNGRLTKLAGYGRASLEWPAPVDPDVRFQLASATKLFTAILLMRMVEQGKLSLDDPLSKFFAGAPESWKTIRVRQLANHTSGLGEDLGSPAPKTVAQAVAAAMAKPLAYPPGSEARYGFTDFTILRAVLEKVGGAALPELFDRELVRPLGLVSTGFAMAKDDGTVRTAEVLPRRASIYAWTGDRQRSSDFFFDPLGYGAGGLYSSARDLAALFTAIDAGKVLSRTSLEALETPAALPGGRKSGFGIGWTVRDYRSARVVGHSGGPALADVLRIPAQGRTIIVLTNQQLFYPMLAERIADLTLREPPLRAVADDRPEIGANLSGLFTAAAANGDLGRFVADGSGAADPLRSDFGKALVAAVGAPQSVQLVRTEPEGLRVYRIRFERKAMDWLVDADASGRITSLRPA